jgi:hypothetical protein
MLRFSLKTMLLLFTVVAVCIAGLVYSNIAWAAFFYTVAFVIVLTGIVGALVRRGPARAFWIGFALFGGGYFALALIGENSLARFGSDMRQGAQPPKLATTQVFIWAERYIHTDASNNSNTARFNPNLVFNSGGIAYYQLTPSQYFVQIGHSIFTLIIALMGGWIGLQFSRKPAADIEPNSSQS